MKSLLAILFLIIIGSVLFFATLRGVPGNPPARSIKNNLDSVTKPFELSPERGRYLLIQNLSEHNSFALSKEQADAAYPDVGYYKGKYFIFFAPGISLFALPFYDIGLQYNLSQVFSFSVVTIISVLNLLFIFLIAKHILKLPVWAGLLASLIYGFGSVGWSYSGTLYQHQHTVFFIMASFYAVWQYKIHKKWGFLWGFFIWTNYALAILIDYPNILLMLPVMIYFLFVSLNIRHVADTYKISFRVSLILTSIFFVIISLLHGMYNNQNFGGWTKVSGGLIGYKTIKEQKLDQGNLDENLKKINEIASKKNPVKFFTEYNLVRSSNELLIAVDKGIFIFNPIFLLGIGGIIYAFRKLTLEKGILLSLVVVNLFFYSSWGDPWGGWAFGPRYLIPSMAVLSLFVAMFLVEVRFTFLMKILAFILLTFSVAVSLLGALTTNAVPPMTEAVYLKMKYGFMFNIDFLTHNRSSSFLYNTYFRDRMTLLQYYEVIFCLVMGAIFIILFIMPLIATIMHGNTSVKSNDDVQVKKKRRLFSGS